MRILLTNDDGIHAPGFAILEEIAKSLSDDVWSVAPLEENSGAGHSLTLTKPLRLRRFGEKRFAVTGTPTDAVMIALAHLMKETPPDLIISGVNRGANLAEDVTYSGTVSAAMEGALAGVPSIALSQAYSREGMGDAVPFSGAVEFGVMIVRRLLDEPLADHTLVNVNFPALPASSIRGVRVSRLGMRDYGRLEVEERKDPRGFPYFWFRLASIVQTPLHDTDLEAISDGYISVTPLHLDLTHGPSLTALKSSIDQEFSERDDRSA